ncbi:MAG: S24 family peptidase [Bacillota bacterium]|nr:S24 family peptidase [Bacillota bacterium]
MSYARMLKDMIDKSNLTLREIADRCRSRGVPLDPSYISKVQSGRQAPPSEEISRALAQACGGDADDLVFEGYTDRAPQVIKDFLASMAGLLKVAFEAMAQGNVPEEALALARKQMSEMTPYRILKSIIPILKLERDPSDGSLCSPGPGPMRFSYPDTQPPDIVLPMPDDSMEPLIPKGAALRLQAVPDYRDGDIVIAKHGTDDYTVRRYLSMADQIALLPMNPNFKPVCYTPGEIVIAGRVKSVSHELPRS